MQISELRLATTALAAQRIFYGDILGLPITNSSATQVSFQIGASQLVFEQTEHELAGVYHFAFDIPENQFDAARAWLASRTRLLADETGQTAFFSEHWNANMVYFADPAGNIVELIARHTLPNASDMVFGVDSILNISEIGVAADDVLVQVAELKTQIGAVPYLSGSPSFMPVGDEHGLLIVVQRGRIWYPNTGKPAEHVPIAGVINGATLSFG